jgi:hypothetical protein
MQIKGKMIKFRIKEFIPIDLKDSLLFDDRIEAIKEMERMSENKDEHLFIVEPVEILDKGD